MSYRNGWPHRLWLILLLALAACASGDDPAAVVERYLRAKAAADRETLRTLLCLPLEADLDREAASYANLETRVEGLTCAYDGSHTVTCGGAIVAVYTGEDRAFPFGAYRVVQEDGEWKWCGQTAR